MGVEMREAFWIARGDQSEAALRDALRDMTDGLNEAQTAYLIEQVNRFHAALESSPIHPDHYGEAAGHLWDRFSEDVQRGLEVRA